MTTNGSTHAHGGGWQKPALAALWAVVVLFLGWLWNANENARQEIAQRQNASAVAVVQNQERIATLEEAVRGLTRSLERIEAGVDELRRDRRR